MGHLTPFLTPHLCPTLRVTEKVAQGQRTEDKKQKDQVHGVGGDIEMTEPQTRVTLDTLFLKYEFAFVRRVIGQICLMFTDEWGIQQDFELNAWYLIG